MRTIPLLSLGLLLAAPGCDAAGLALGVGTRCAAEKQEVRQRHGTPDRVDEGTRSELWAYNRERLTYRFSWDQDGEGCSVSTSSFVRLPASR